MKVERPRARSSAAPTRLNSRSTTPIRARLRRHEGAHLRQHGDQRVLAQEGRLARHVGAGDQRQPPPSSCAPRGRSHWRRRLAARGERRLDHRMAAGLDREGERVVDERARPVALRRRARRAPRRRRARPAPRRCRASSASRPSACRRRPLEQTSSSSASARSAAEAMRASSSTSSTVVKRIAPAMVWRWMKVARMRGFSSASPCRLRHLDVIAEHVVVLDLERRDAGLVGVARLQRGDHAPALVAQRARLVERGEARRRDEAAVARDERQLVGERRLEVARQRAVVARRAASQAARQRRPAASGAVSSVAPMRGAGVEAVAQRGEIARAAAVERQPRQRAHEIRRRRRAPCAARRAAPALRRERRPRRAARRSPPDRSAGSRAARRSAARRPASR